ncbi:alpha-1,2-fucosyltransferase [bacterium]|nr:alpha-1,2-fucosyltransferase [bacterium]
MLSFKSIGYLGRLGNQMFQFASSVAIAKKTGNDIFFPLENCTAVYPNGPINPKTNSPIPVKCDLLDCFDIPVSFFKRAIEINTGSIMKEKVFTFDPDMFNVKDGSDLHGFFQTEKYFKPIEHDIHRYFSFKNKIEESCKEYWSLNIEKFLDGNKSVSIHVRRGDYTLYPGHHPVCSDEYYNQAISRFDPEFRFLIFSDDLEWCRSKFISDRFFIVDSGDPFKDLKLISMCDHHIIANSSFSWWGSWLNRKEKKRTICPSYWFGPMINKNTKDIYCEGWEVI